MRGTVGPLRPGDLFIPGPSNTTSTATAARSAVMAPEKIFSGSFDFDLILEIFSAIPHPPCPPILPVREATVQRTDQDRANRACSGM